MAKTFPDRVLGQFPQPSWFNGFRDWITFQSGLVVNVKEAPYNAVGDGIVDDTAAIQAAIADAKASGAGTFYSTATARRLYIPPGIYGISANLDFASGGQWLSVTGDGPAVSIFKALSSAAKLTFANSRTRIGGFTFDGNSLATTGIAMNGATTTTFFDIYALHCVGNGIETHNLQNSILDNIGAQYNGGSGLVVDDGTGSCVFRRCDLHDNTKHQLLITDTDTISSAYPEPTLNSFINCLLEFPVNGAATGTAAAGGSTTTLVVAGTPWTVNQWAGAFVTKNAGGGAQAGARIISNTNNTLTLEAGMFGAAPDGLAYRIDWPICRVDASNQNMFDGMIAGSGALGEYPVLHVTRHGGTESQASITLRNCILTASATYHTALEINGISASVRMGADTQIVGAKLGIRFTDVSSSTRLLGSLPTFNSVTTPLTFVAGSMDNNALEVQNGILRRVTSYGAAHVVTRQQVSGEANFRYVRDASGRMDWGDGTAVPDTSLRRGGANWLFTDDSFTAALAIWSRAIVTKTANYTTTVDDQVVLGDATSGVVTITLPAAATTGKVITLKKTDAVNNVVLSRAGSATIDGATTKTITTQYGFLTVISNGTNWSIIASGGTIT
jgi:hypothetical protein